MVWDRGWDELFSKQAWGRYPPEELVRFVARNYYRAPNRAEIKILEIGCGPGANLWYLAREGFCAYGLDGSRVALSQAARYLESAGVTARLSQGDATALPYPSGSFDCVLDIECIYANALPDTRRIIGEVHRVLAPGGKFFSKTFMTGTYGDGNGSRVGDEPHTYTAIERGALHGEYGLIRFTAEEEIQDLYGAFSRVEYDYLIRSDKNRGHEVREWLIVCEK